MTSTRGSVWPSVTVNGVAVVCARAGDRDELAIVEQADADQAGFRRHERLDVGGVTLGDGPGAVDVVVGDHEHAASLRPRIARDADGVVDVQRPVGAERGRRPHRAGQHDRLVALDDEVEEVRRLLHRVGAVRDRDAVDVRLREQLVHAFASLSHTSSFMSWLPMRRTCSPRTSANVLSCGTAAIRTSTATAPDL